MILRPTTEDIFAAIELELGFQDEKATRLKWDMQKKPMEWVTILEAELNEVKHEYCKGTYEDVMAEILQVAAVAVACIRINGLFEREDLVRDNHHR